jgi:hypothetical protein
MALPHANDGLMPGGKLLTKDGDDPESPLQQVTTLDDAGNTTLTQTEDFYEFDTSQQDLEITFRTSSSSSVDEDVAMEFTVKDPDIDERATLNVVDMKKLESVKRAREAQRGGGEDLNVPIDQLYIYMNAKSNEMQGIAQELEKDRLLHEQRLPSTFGDNDVEALVELVEGKYRPAKKAYRGFKERGVQDQVVVRSMRKEDTRLYLQRKMARAQLALFAGGRGAGVEAMDEAADAASVVAAGAGDGRVKEQLDAMRDTLRERDDELKESEMSKEKELQEASEVLRVRERKIEELNVKLREMLNNTADQNQSIYVPPHHKLGAINKTAAQATANNTNWRDPDVNLSSRSGNRGFGGATSALGGNGSSSEQGPLHTFHKDLAETFNRAQAQQSRAMTEAMKDIVRGIQDRRASQGGGQSGGQSSTRAPQEFESYGEWRNHDD